jgi:hypothetical protein
MAIDFYWGSGSPGCWRVALALEFKGLPYNSHLLHFDRQEHQSPQMLAMNFRGKVPVLRDDDYVVFESLAILYYLDQKYPEPAIFGRNPQESGVIMRVICEYQAYAEPPLKQIVSRLLEHAEHAIGDELAEAMHRVAGTSACCCGRCIDRMLRSWRRASCRWKSTTRPSGAGSSASRHSPDTSAPGRRTGADLSAVALAVQHGRCYPSATSTAGAS